MGLLTSLAGELSGAFGGVRDFVGDAVDDITGTTAAEAATEAAQIQADAASSAAASQAQSTADQIAFLQQAQAEQASRLDPFTQFGAGFIDPAQAAIANTQELFGPGAVDAVMNSPLFQALLDRSQQDILQNAAVRGRVGSSGTLDQLQTSALLTGFDVLNRERSAALQNAGFLANLVGQGQSAAAGQGAGALQTGQSVAGAQQAGTTNIANLLTSGAAAQAGGVVGAANAQQQGTANVIGLGTTLFGVPTIGGGI